MRGGITRTEALYMSPQERKEVVDYISHIYEEREVALTGQRKM